MQERIPAFSVWEFLGVLGVAFALPLLGSLMAWLTPGSGVGFSNALLTGMIVQELLVLLVLGTVLYLRGWRPAELGLAFGWRDVGMGCVLAVACVLATYPLQLLQGMMVKQANPSFEDIVAGSLSLGTVVAVSLVNPVFEEVFVCGYLIRALERVRSRAFAVNVSVALRASYHLYQGAIGTIAIVIVGLILGWYFARSGRLWPAIVAHALMDLLALAVYIKPA